MKTRCLVWIANFFFRINIHPKITWEGSYNSLINMLHISHVSHSFCQCATANTVIKRHTAPSPGETELLCVKCPKPNQTSTKKKMYKSYFSLYFPTILLTANLPHFLCPRHNILVRDSTVTANPHIALQPVYTLYTTKMIKKTKAVKTESL